MRDFTRRDLYYASLKFRQISPDVQLALLQAFMAKSDASQFTATASPNATDGAPCHASPRTRNFKVATGTSCAVTGRKSRSSRRPMVQTFLRDDRLRRRSSGDRRRSFYRLSASLRFAISVFQKWPGFFDCASLRSR